MQQIALFTLALIEVATARQQAVINGQAQVISSLNEFIGHSHAQRDSDIEFYEAQLAAKERQVAELHAVLDFERSQPKRHRRERKPALLAAPPAPYINPALQSGIVNDDGTLTPFETAGIVADYNSPGADVTDIVSAAPVATFQTKGKRHAKPEKTDN